MSVLRVRLSFLLRLVVSVGLISLAISRLDFDNMMRFLGRADGALVAVTLVTVLVDRALMATRWILLFEALEVHVPRLRVVKIFFLSTFFGSFLPSGIGGEAVRAVSVSQLSSRAMESVASVVMDRVLGLLSMLLTGLLSLTIFYRVYPHPALLAVVTCLSIATIGSLVLVLSKPLHERLRVRFRKGAGRIANWSTKMVETLARYRERLDTLLLVLFVSIVVQLLRVLQAFLLSESMALEVGAIYFLCFIPPILVVTMLPISVGGWGTANVAYVALFSQVGMDPDGAFVLSILILALGVFGNLPGGFIYAWEGFAASERPAV